eukprot:15262983-Alexandrium_andersonii.AAC.1
METFRTTDLQRIIVTALALGTVQTVLLAACERLQVDPALHSLLSGNGHGIDVAAIITHVHGWLIFPLWLLPHTRLGDDSLRGGGRRPAASPDQAPAWKAPRSRDARSPGPSVASRGPSSSRASSAVQGVTFQ